LKGIPFARLWWGLARRSVSRSPSFGAVSSARLDRSRETAVCAFGYVPQAVCRWRTVMVGPIDGVLAIHNAFRADMAAIDAAAAAAARGTGGLEATVERFRFFDEILT